EAQPLQRVLGELAERVLDDAILERVERDDREAGAGVEARHRLAQERGQIVELAVHPDAQRLERPCRRIDALPATGWNGPAYDGGELARRRDGFGTARRDDRAGDPP